MMSELAVSNDRFPTGLGIAPRTCANSLRAWGENSIRPADSRNRLSNFNFQLPNVSAWITDFGIDTNIMAGRNSPGRSQTVSTKPTSVSVKQFFASGESVRHQLEKLANRFNQRSRHELENAWLTGHRHEFSGKWIALDGETLLAAGTSAKEVFASVKNHTPTPLVMQIVEDHLPFAGW